MATDTEPKRTRFYQIPLSVMAYKWTHQIIGAVQRRSLDSEGKEIMQSVCRVRKGDWIVEHRSDGSVMYAATDQWMRKFWEDRPVREVIVEAPCTVHTCDRHDSGD